MAKKCFIYIAITLITIILLFPFIWMISTSLKEADEMFAANPTFLPEKVSLTN